VLGVSGRPIDWVIIGAQTKPTRLPDPSWVRAIICVADHAGIPVFLKYNLQWPQAREEFPK
jgi:protein gp37